MSFRAWADLPAHHAASLSRGRPPGYRKSGALPAGGRKNTAGRPAWVAATCPMPPFYLVRPVQEGVHSLPPGANPGTYRRRTNIHPPKKGLRYERRKENWLSVELENNHVDLWAHGDDETLVNLAVAATANIVAAACGNDVKEAEKLLQDVKIGLDAALDQALEHPTQEINPEDFKAIGPADLPAKPLGKA